MNSILCIINNVNIFKLLPRFKNCCITHKYSLSRCDVNMNSNYYIQATVSAGSLYAEFSYQLLTKQSIFAMANEFEWSGLHARNTFMKTIRENLFMHDVS